MNSYQQEAQAEQTHYRREYDAPTSTSQSYRFPLNTSLFGVEVVIRYEEGLFFIQSTSWDSLIASGDKYPEAKEEFLQLLQDVYSSYSQNTDEELSNDGRELRNFLENNKAYFLNAN